MGLDMRMTILESRLANLTQVMQELISGLKDTPTFQDFGSSLHLGDSPVTTTGTPSPLTDTSVTFRSTPNYVGLVSILLPISLCFILALGIWLKRSTRVKGLISNVYLHIMDRMILSCLAMLLSAYASLWRERNVGAGVDDECPVGSPDAFYTPPESPMLPRD